MKKCLTQVRCQLSNRLTRVTVANGIDRPTLSSNNNSNSSLRIQSNSRMQMKIHMTTTTDSNRHAYGDSSSMGRDEELNGDGGAILAESPTSVDGSKQQTSNNIATDSTTTRTDLNNKNNSNDYYLSFYSNSSEDGSMIVNWYDNEYLDCAAKFKSTFFTDYEFYCVLIWVVHAFISLWNHSTICT